MVAAATNGGARSKTLFMPRETVVWLSQARQPQGLYSAGQTITPRRYATFVNDARRGRILQFRMLAVPLTSRQLIVGVLNIFLLRWIRNVVLVNFQEIDFGLQTEIDGPAQGLHRIGTSHPLRSLGS